MRIPDLQEDDYSYMVGLGLLMWIFLVLFIVLSAKIGEPLLSLWDSSPVPVLQLHQLCPRSCTGFRQVGCLWQLKAPFNAAGFPASDMLVVADSMAIRP